MLEEPFRRNWNWDVVELIFIYIKVYESVISLHANLFNPSVRLSLGVSNKKKMKHTLLVRITVYSIKLPFYTRYCVLQKKSEHV